MAMLKIMGHEYGLRFDNFFLKERISPCKMYLYLKLHFLQVTQASKESGLAYRNTDLIWSQQFGNLFSTMRMKQ